ncbi:ANKRD17 [Symbiodinium pilosum]|uniref:ANKRD17 protein n=1 Tax=Symbiodinium pilosum TaxID=2952 RepID=A0A812LZ49_SYMPI|nr:ANKRD17 [Symbiodinium pilosum]
MAFQRVLFVSLLWEHPCSGSTPGLRGHPSSLQGTSANSSARLSNLSQASDNWTHSGCCNGCDSGFCSPASGSCYNQKAKHYYLDCASAGQGGQGGQDGTSRNWQKTSEYGQQPQERRGDVHEKWGEHELTCYFFDKEDHWFYGYKCIDQYSNHFLCMEGFWMCQETCCGLRQPGSR